MLLPNGNVASCTMVTHFKNHLNQNITVFEQATEKEPYYKNAEFQQDETENK